jgi:rhodanese-related sulfurtransferase
MDIDFKNLNMNSICIIDIRNKNDYLIGHIPNAINISNDDIVLNPDKYFNKNICYYLYCERGIKSLKLSSYLNNLGYNTYSIKGGYLEWKRVNNIN